MSDSVGGQIISELGQVARDVGTQTAKVPGDIAGKALESLGTAGVKSQKSTASPAVSEGGTQKTAWEAIDSQSDQRVKKQMARKALEDLLSGTARKPKEPSIWERLQMEQDQKREQQMNQKKASAQQLQVPVSKRPRGDLYGTKAKQTSTENRNVRQD